VKRIVIAVASAVRAFAQPVAAACRVEIFVAAMLVRAMRRLTCSKPEPQQQECSKSSGQPKRCVRKACRTVRAHVAP